MRIMIFLLLTINLLSSNSVEENTFLNNMADIANKKAQEQKNIKSRRLRISEARVEENYTLNLDLQLYFPNLELKKKFKYINYISMKKKFCKDRYFRRMKNGLKINFNYFNHEDILITKFMLDKESCKECNFNINSISKKHKMKSS